MEFKWDDVMDTQLELRLRNAFVGGRIAIMQ